KIVLVDLNKLGFNLDLLRLGSVRLVNQGIDHIQVILRVANDQHTGVRPERRAGDVGAAIWQSNGGELNAHALQHRFGVSATDELTVVQQMLPGSASSLN